MSSRVGHRHKRWRRRHLAMLVIGLIIVSGPGASAGDRAIWVQRYAGPAKGNDIAFSVVVSPGGSRVFVTGFSTGAGTGDDYATAAYDASTGVQLWGERYDGPVHGDDIARSIATSPDGSRVFVTGESPGSNIYNEEFTTVAYDATTGAQLWVNRLPEEGSGQGQGYSIAVSRDGSMVIATGFSFGDGTLHDFTTMAYDSSTGAQVWKATYNGHNDASDVASALALSPDGSKVFVTGYVAEPTGFDYGTVAYDASTGAQLWGESYAGVGNGADLASAVAVSPGGYSVFVTGASGGANGEFDYATVAYEASTGSRLWVRRYNGPAGLNDAAASIAVAPGGSTIFVTGQSDGSAGGPDVATLAYDSATGARRWLRRYNGSLNGNDFGRSLAVSPGGRKVFVTGYADNDYVTLAYRAATGTGVWLQSYDGPAKGSDSPYAIGVSPGGSKVYITGASDGPNGDSDWATIAYSS